MRRGGDGDQPPGRDQCEPAREPSSALPQGLCSCAAPGPGCSHPGFACSLFQVSQCRISRGLLPQTCLKNDALLFLSLPLLYFSSSIHSLLPEMIFSSGSLTESFYKGKNSVLIAEPGHDRCSKEKMLAE